MAKSFTNEVYEVYEGYEGYEGYGGVFSVSGFGAYSGQNTSPLLASAILSTQAELTRVITGISHPDEAEYRLDDNHAYPRWSPDIRARLYAFSLVSDLWFDGDADTATLYSRANKPAVDGAGVLTGQYQILFKLKRPKYDYKAGTAPAGAPGGALPDELQHILNKASLRADRMAEILTQVAVPVSFFSALLNLQPGRHRNTLELMSVGFEYAAWAGQQFKDHFRVVRAADRSALVQPLLMTPQHGSYPAGHAIQSYLVKDLLIELTGAAAGSDVADQLEALADRIGDNRVIAGVHYPIDIEEGAKLGSALAKRMIGWSDPANRAPVAANALQWLWAGAKAEWN